MKSLRSFKAWLTLIYENDQAEWIVQIWAQNEMRRVVLKFKKKKKFYIKSNWSKTNETDNRKWIEIRHKQNNEFYYENKKKANMTNYFAQHMKAI